MPTTTIKVDTSVRERLATVARARGITMTALLERAAEQLEREQRWTDIEAAYERLQRDEPVRWAEYLSELAEWDVAAESDSSAAEEWPELNS